MHSLKRTHRGVVVTAVASLLAILSTACSPTDERSSIEVLAASSLTDVLTDLAERFESEPGSYPVALSFASSSILATQVTSGAPADIIMTADQASMDTALADTHLTSQPLVRNDLIIAVEPGNPLNITTAADLGTVRVARCADPAPCGLLADAALTGISITPTTQAADAKSTLLPLTLGDVDAALVYRTDAMAASMDIIEFDQPVSTQYRLAILTESDPADAFAAYITSTPAAAVWREHGFQEP